MLNNKNRIKFILAICFIFAFSFVTSAQSLERSVVATAGNHLTAGGLSLEYTIGETVVGEFSNSSLSVNQGFNQGNLGGTGSIRKTAPLLSLKAHPNPATSILNVIVDVQATAVVYDLSGKIIIDGISLSKNNSKIIDINMLSSGVYFLKVNSDNSTTTLMWVKE